MRTLFFAALCALYAVQAGAVELAKFIDRKAVVFVHVPDFPVLLKQFEKSPLSKTARDEKVKKFFAPALAKMDLPGWDEKQKASTGLSYTDLLALPKGEVLLAVVDGEAKATPLLLVEVGEENGAKVNDFIRQALNQRNNDERQITISEETIGDVTLHEATVVRKVQPPKPQPGDVPTEKPEPQTSNDSLQWFVREGVLVFGEGKKDVTQVAISLSQGGATDPLSQADSYIRSVDRVQGQGLGLTVDFNQIAPAVRRHLAKQPQPAQKNPITDPENLLRTSGIDELDTLYAAFRFEDQAMVSEAGLRYRNFSGLVTLFPLGQGPVPQPEFVPEGWLAVNSFRLKLGDVFSGIEGLFQAHHPAAAALFSGNLAMTNAKVGFDVKRDLFGSFGDEVIMASVARPGVPIDRISAFDIDDFYSLSVADAKTLATVLDSLLKQMDPQNKGLIAKKEFGGSVIHSIPMPPDPVRGQRFINLCLWQDKLFISIGTTSPIEAAILTATRKDTNFWQREDVQRALAETPADAGGFAFQDNRVMLAMLMETFVRVAEMAAREGKAEQAPLVDPAAQPDISDLAKYWAPSQGYFKRDASGIHVVSKLPYIQ
ncbi:MAG: hypothetical protein SFV32_07965 [Opitutaceae bacterium]|nr:hypothetical protein [Opitutaceae bacterium]